MNEVKAKGLGRKVVMASWLAIFILFGYRATFSVLLAPMQADMGWSVSQLSLGYSLMMSVYAVTAFFSGMIIDKYGTKPAYAIGSVAAALGFFVTSFAQEYWQFLVPYALFAGIGTGMLWVSSTISVRKWYVGKAYATMWGLAFMGAPVAQVVLSLGLKQVLATMDWRQAMQILAVVAFVALAIATIVAKKNPENYGIEPFGLVKGTANTPAKPEYVWTIKEAFGKLAIWCAIGAFLTAMIGEFLIWTQVVNYLVNDVNLTQSEAINVYVSIGIVGIFSMPLMGIVADKVVGKVDVEARGRKIMLIFAPLVGVVACGLLLMAPKSMILAYVACVLFAIYWAIEPGGVAGYAGSIYGRVSLGKIWGTSTLIVMGIGPFTGSFMGGFLFDISGAYTNSILFAMGAFAVSAVIAVIMPLSAVPDSESVSISKASLANIVVDSTEKE